jgi:hypothetical protein
MKTNKTTKKGKISNYKKAYEDLLIEHEDLSVKHTYACRQFNTCLQWIGALKAARKIEFAAFEEMDKSHAELIKFD